VEYGIASAGNYVESECVPRSFDGVLVTFRSIDEVLVTAYFPLKKQQTCTKLASTNVAGVAAGITGGP
jgi:hypothetical protein